MTHKKNKKTTLLFFLIVLLSGIAYIFWRWFYTLNLVTSPFTTFWSISLLVAETLILIVFANFSLILLNLDEAEEIVINNQLQDDYYKDVFHNGELVTFKNFCPSVDIFICTLNESIDLLSTTISACANIDYPNKKVYVLDDGRREEVKQLTQMLGCNYITRQTNKGFKAGNINNALSLTDSDIIVVFDADHMPASTFLRETVYNFVDENLALVQTPQHFCNLDAFQKNLLLPEYLANEQDLFYKLIEPSLNVVGSVFCGGTNILIRRKHLNAVGNFPETTITEDSLLGLIFHANKYRVYFYNRTVAIGLAASSFDEYIKQRIRWAKGNVQIFKNPKNWHLYAKLKPIQAFFYLSSGLYFFTPLARLIFLFAPVLFLFFDISPLLILFYSLFIFQVAYFSLKFIFIYVKSVNPGNVILSDVYDLITSIFTIGGITKVMLLPECLQKIKFAVTSKEFKTLDSNFSYKLVLILLLILLILAEIQGIYDILYGDVYSLLAVIANLFWNSINIFVLIFGIRVVFEKPERRVYQRVDVNDEITLTDCNQKNYKVNIIDASRSGVSFETEETLEDTETCDLKVDFGGLQLFVDIINSVKKNSHYIYKSAFKKPLTLYRLTKKRLGQLSKYVKFAYKKPDEWNDKK